MIQNFERFSMYRLCCVHVKDLSFPRKTFAFVMISTINSVKRTGTPCAERNNTGCYTVMRTTVDLLPHSNIEQEREKEGKTTSLRRHRLFALPFQNWAQIIKTFTIDTIPCRSFCTFHLTLINCKHSSEIKECLPFNETKLQIKNQTMRQRWAPEKCVEFADKKSSTVKTRIFQQRFEDLNTIKLETHNVYLGS